MYIKSANRIPSMKNSDNASNKLILFLAYFFFSIIISPHDKLLTEFLYKIRIYE